MNAPNLLTIARILAAPLVPLVLIAAPGPAGVWAAFWIFVAAALTDFLDGWLARRLGQVSALGRMLDPIADKVMVSIACATLTALHGLWWPVMAPVAAILAREVLVSGLREYLKGADVGKVTSLAKWKTAVQMVALGALILAEALPVLAAPGLALLWLAAALTVVTGWDYFRRGLAYIRAEET